MSFLTELLKGNLKNLVLALLEDGDKYGYQIIKDLNDRTDALLEVGEGSMYPALHALEKRKLLKSYWKKQSEGPDRKYYSLTQKGRKELVTVKKEWGSFSHAVQKIYGLQIS